VKVVFRNCDGDAVLGIMVEMLRKSGGNAVLGLVVEMLS
jgi:hypothetical protein